MASLINGNRMFCTHCKGDFFLVLPMGLTEMCATMRAFTKLHKVCKQNYSYNTIKHLIKKNMNLYTIYKSPTDFPNTYVCRRWEINPPNNEPVAMEVVIIDDNLDKIRNQLREVGLFPIPRDESDDIKIIETWL